MYFNFVYKLKPYKYTNPHIHDHIKSIVHIKSQDVLDVQAVDSETHKVAIGNCAN